MSAFTSKAAGDWSAAGQTTWNEVGVPGDGDTATIDHNIVVDVDTTVGTSAAEETVDAIDVSGANLTIAEDIILTVRDGVVVGVSREIVLELGAVFKFDASQASDPTNQNYRIKLGPGGHGRIATLICNGTEVKPCTVTSEVGGGNGYIDPTGWQSGQVRTSWTNFSKLGTASISGMRLRPVSGGTVVLSDCTFDNCGLVFMQAASTTIVGTLNRVSFTNSLNATFSFQYQGGDATAVVNCSFDKRLDFAGAGLGGEVSSCYLHNTWQRTNFQGLDVLKNNFIRTAIDLSMSIREALAEDIYLFDDSGLTNGRAFSLIPNDRNVVLSGCIIEHPSGTVGDYVLDSVSSVANTVTIQNCLLLPNESGVTPGGFLNLLNNHGSGEAYELYHNTVVTTGVGETGIAGYGENEPGTAAEIPAVKSNLIWTPQGKTAGAKAVRRNNAATPIQDAISPGGWDYNWGWNLAAGTEGNGFQDFDADPPDMFSAVPTDSNGGSGDPQFVDSTRNLATWGSSEEGTDGSVAQALAVLQADTTKIAELLTWVKAGFAPQNISLQDAGHDGVTIGAVEFVAVPTGGVARMIFLTGEAA